MTDTKFVRSLKAKLTEAEHTKYKGYCVTRKVAMQEDLADLIRKHRLQERNDNGDRLER